MFDTPPPNLPTVQPANPTSALPPTPPTSSVASSLAIPLVTPSMVPPPPSATTSATPKLSEPEDPFSAVDPQGAMAHVQTPNRAAPVATPASAPDLPLEVFAPSSTFPWKGLIITLAALLVLGGGAYALLATGIFNRSASIPPTESLSVPTPITTTTELSPLTPPEPAPQIAPDVDTDGDGLIDTEETTLGANSTSPDTDGDGLFDGEEVKVFHTDPLKRDTDGDNFTDGEEVKNGFNPSGSGRLFAVPATPPKQ